MREYCNICGKPKPIQGKSLHHHCDKELGVTSVIPDSGSHDGWREAFDPLGSVSAVGGAMLYQCECGEKTFSPLKHQEEKHWVESYLLPKHLRREQ